jgi:ribosomal protein S12 methylthiotransferase
VLKGEKVYAAKKEPEIFEKIIGKTLLTPRSHAYIKIAEGCDNRCSYCLIPYLKGKYRSRRMEDILEEVKSVIRLGVKEIILVAQDCGYYGKDLYGTNSLANLLQNIEKIPGDFWCRVLYIYPERIDESLLKTIAKSKKICKYLDIPLQHGDSEVLRMMFRPSIIKNTLQKIAKIKKIIPQVSLRTSIIVGFPGETEKAFKNLESFVKKIDFDHLGVFEYSREPGTPAYKMPNQIPTRTKSVRREKIMLLQQKISTAKNKKLKGKNFKTLIEKYDPKANLYIGRTEKFAPEIDGEVIIKSKKSLKLYEFANVKITKAGIYDLYGEVA